MTAVYAIVLFVLLIFPHELGHFLVAKMVGVKVNEFSFGMGPAIFKKQKGETLYAIRLLPVGGYCAMEGEDEESDDERAFVNKPAWARIAVLIAGAAMNIIIAVLVATITYKSLVSGCKATVYLGELMFKSLAMLISGEAGVSDLAGPVGIISMAGDTATYGLTYFGNLVVLMSLNLAIINLLPLPALDGGRILFVVIRKIAGEHMSDEMEGKVHGIGFMLLLALIVFVTWNDITRLFT
ncbi:MAG: site-2 protease family protein [Eubacteriaceae bacterium]|nr:site-2 protease family protein [Eubacteriaceae bacterium]